MKVQFIGNLMEFDYFIGYFPELMRQVFSEKTFNISTSESQK